jgi:tetratricopeptide (TPR) repeat protein
VLRAELQGARLVSSLGGFYLTPHSPDKISAGPIFISMVDSERSFDTFLSQIRVKQLHLPASPEDDPLAAWLDLMAHLEAEERDGAVDVSVKERLEKLFSLMRFAAVLEEGGNLEAALSRLREVKSAYKAVIASRMRRRAEFQSAQYGVSLSLRNPAFSRKRSTRRYRQLADKYEIELLTALGGQEIASPDDRLSSGIQYWCEAILLARDEEQYQQVREKIRETARGRAYVLKNKHQYEEAICLLEQVDELCGDEEVRTLLSRLCAIEGIRVCNEGDLESAIPSLRRAVYLNPYSLYAQRNLARVLIFLVDDIHERGGSARLRMLLEEAMDAIHACMYLDEGNEEYQQMEILTRAKLNFLRIESGEINMGDLSPVDMSGLLLLMTK